MANVARVIVATQEAGELADRVAELEARLDVGDRRTA